jgi:hypothetical protein
VGLSFLWSAAGVVVVVVVVACDKIFSLGIQVILPCVNLHN